MKPSPLVRGALLVSAASAVVAVVISFGDQSRGCGTDLRHKVVGARAILAGLDPYRFEWQPGMPETLLDPRRRLPGPSMATYPPTTLAFYVPLAWIPYWTQKRVWFVLEWCAMVGATVLLSRTVRPARARWAFLCVALIFFMSSRFWRLHLERGQYYVFVLLLLAAGAARWLRRADDVLAGVLLGLAAALRPTFVLLCVPLWLLGRRRLATATTLTFLTACLATLPLVGWRGWTGFVDTTGAWERVVMDRGHLERYGPAREVPRIVEGVDFTQLLSNGVGNATLMGVFQKQNLLSGTPVPALVPVLSRGLALLVVAAGATLMMLARRRKPLPRRYVMALGILFVLDLEYFLPARVAYADVLYMLPLALMLPLVMRARSPLPVALVAAGLLLGHPFHEGFDTWLTPDLIRATLVIGTLTAMSVWVIIRRGRGTGEGRA